MFIHSVYFTLRDDLQSSEREQFLAGVRSLVAIESVQQGFIGVPAATDRPVIARDYSYALVLIFADDAAQESYQTHPVHDRFREDCARCWTSVRIYDAVTDETTVAGARRTERS